MSISYGRETALTAAEYCAVVGATSLAPRRPLGNPARIADMLAGSNLIVGARDDGRLVGLARCMTDFAWVCYCADLAVADTHQGQGIGHGLLDELAQILGDGIAISLIAFPEAVTFYERIGWQATTGFYHPRRNAD